MRGTPLLPVRRVSGGAVTLTPAKLNLFLEIEGRRRPDGYHDLTTLMVAVDLRDTLCVRASSSGRDQLIVSGIEVPDDDRNLALKTLARVREECPVPAVEIHLRKRIPVGSGLGGGSGNAAGMLNLLRELHASQLSDEDLFRFAGEIGSDVPFFLGDGVAVATGRGERLRALEGRPFGGDRPVFLVIIPRVFSSTLAAYGQVTFPLTSPDGPISFHEKTFVTSRDWVTGLFNRLEGPVLASVKELQPLVDWLERRVPGRWRMTGSGSAFYVVCLEPGEVDHLARRLREERPDTLVRGTRGLW